MKIIYPNLITAIGASSENANYPALNMLNDIPKKIWQSADNNACSVWIVFSVTDDVPVTDLFIDFTNIEGEIRTYTATGSLVQTVAVSRLTGDKYTYPMIWAELNGTGIANAVISASAVSEGYIYAGIVRAGTCYEFRSPKIGMNAGIDNRSRLFSMHDGSQKHMRLNSGMTYKVDLRSDYESVTGQADALIKLKGIGYEPVPVKVFHAGYDNPLFARIQGLSGSHDGSYAGHISFDLNEVI